MNMNVAVVEASSQGVTLRIDFPQRSRPARRRNVAWKMDPSIDWAAKSKGDLYDFACKLYDKAKSERKNPRRVWKAVKGDAIKNGVDEGAVRQVDDVIEMMSNHDNVPGYNAWRGAAR